MTTWLTDRREVSVLCVLRFRSAKFILSLPKGSGRAEDRPLMLSVGAQRRSRSMRECLNFLPLPQWSSQCRQLPTLPTDLDPLFVAERRTQYVH